MSFLEFIFYIFAGLMGMLVFAGLWAFIRILRISEEDRKIYEDEIKLRGFHGKETE